MCIRDSFGTCNVRFDYMWGIDGGHGKTYASFAVYRGLSEGGFVTLDKTSADASVTAGNGEYTLAGAVYGVYQGGSLVAQFTTDESGHGQTSEKLPNGDYVVREISAPAGYALSQEAVSYTHLDVYKRQCLALAYGKMTVIVFSPVHFYAAIKTYPIMVAFFAVALSPPGLISAALAKARIPKRLIVGVLVLLRFFPTAVSYTHLDVYKRQA